MESGDATRPARISEDEFRARRERVAKAARDEGFDAILVVGRTSATLDNMGNIHWLTRHYSVPPLITPTGKWRSYGQDALVITADGRAALVAVGTTDPPVIDDVRTGLDVDGMLIDLLRELGLADARVGLAGSDVMAWNLSRSLDRELPGLELEPCDLLLAQLRVTLSPAECDLVRRAAEVGCEILTAGLEAGDMVHPDCFGYVDGYMYDVQRTVVAGGRPSAEQQALIDGCTGMVKFLGEALHDGITCREVHAAGTGYLDRHAPDDLLNAWGDTYGHFGHGFTSGFDWPFLGADVPGADLPLEAPFAVTIELWWGRADVGAALVEDEFLVLPDRVEDLTSHLLPG